MTLDNATTDKFTIGKAGKLSGVPIETIRYYERRGLMPAPLRTESGYRLYSQKSVTRLCFIKEAQSLGFTLEEIAELLALRVDAESTCEDVRRRAERKVAEIEDKIRALQAMQAALVEMVAACEQGGPEGNCPFLDTIERRTQERKESK